MRAGRAGVAEGTDLKELTADSGCILQLMRAAGASETGTLLKPSC